MKDVSIFDFCKRIDAIDGINDKRKFAGEYIMRYGLNDAKPYYSLEEVVHVARMKLADASLQQKEKLINDEEARENKCDYPPSVVFFS